MPRPLLTVAAVALTLAATVAPRVAAATPRAPVEHAGLDQGAPAYYDSGAARTPYMGWNSYFAVGAASEEKVLGVADFLVSSGLAEAGYHIVWTLHAKGLRAGIYTDTGARRSRPPSSSCGRSWPRRSSSGRTRARCRRR